MDRDQYDDGFVISNREVEPVFDELRWLASRSPRWFWIDVFYDIPHSCLEYVMGVMAEERFGSTIIWLGGTWKFHPMFGFASSI